MRPLHRRTEATELVVSTSIRTRFAASFLANFLRSLISFLTGLLLARWLGPSEYGRMVFLLASFAAFRQLLDMGTSSAFFTFLSQKPRTARFIRTFWYWVAAQLALSLLLVCLILPDALVRQVWVGEARILVALALVASFMQGVVWTSASQMAEACRETVRLQRLNTTIVLIHLCVLVALWFWELLAIPFVFAALIIEWGVAAWLAARMYQTQVATSQDESGEVISTRAIAREYFSYCGPMIPYVWLAFAHDFADRWMLQHWGGSAEQAYFGVAQQFSTVALLATTSIMSILWKEAAEAAHQGDIVRLQHLYAKVSRLLYFVGAATACFLIPWAPDLLQFAVGDAYIGGGGVLMLMLVYPVHQSLGQVCGTMLMATGNARLQVKLSSVFLAIGLVSAYILLAPKTADVPGLGLGAEGLAWKLVFFQVVAVNLFAYVIARKFGWGFRWLFQLWSFLLFSVVSWSARYLVAALLQDSHLGLQFSAACILYAFVIGLALLFWPNLAGVARQDLAKIAEKIPIGLRF